MHPYTAQENEWLSGHHGDPAPSAPLPKPVAQIDDAVIRMHMRRGERIRAQEVRRVFGGLFRLPGTALRALGAYLRPPATHSHH
ncbi:MAG: hypothetical protein RLO01_06435 [Thalassobaculaceae bacterium]